MKSLFQQISKCLFLLSENVSMIFLFNINKVIRMKNVLYMFNVKVYVTVSINYLFRIYNLSSNVSVPVM